MNDKLRQVQKVELEIMDVIHRVCVEHNFKYSLAYGTLIGAVRHGGFIPWDDDIDICMPREDYEKFIEIWPKYGFTEYILQNTETDEDFTQNFTKIRKNNTTFLQPKEEELQYHKGIFVDIFPGEKVPDSNLKRKIQFVNVAVNLLYSRKFGSGRNNKIMAFAEKLLLAIPKSKYKKYRNKAQKQMTKYNGDKSLAYVFPSTMNAARNYYPADIFENLTLINFEGKQYYAYQDYDKCLRIEYGNYMELPPKEERVWKHTPIIIDFEKNYDDIIRDRKE